MAHADSGGTAIRLGDTICFSLIDGVADNKLVMEKLHHGVNMPPNPRDVRFIIRRSANRRALNELNRMSTKQDDYFASDAKKGAYDGRAELQRLAELEEQQNADDSRRLHRTAVRYGAAVELHHVGTGKVLCIMSDTGPNPGTLAVQLRDPSEASTDAHIRLFPALNSHDSHVDALTIRNGNLVVMEFVDQAMRLLITDSSAPGGGDRGTTLRSRAHPHVSRVDSVCATHTAGLRMEIMQLRPAEPEASVERKARLAKRLNGSDVIKLAFTQTLEEVALPAASWTGAGLVHATRPVFDRSIYKHHTFTNSMSWWVLEKTEMPGTAEEICVGARHHYRLKHFVTGVYLGYIDRGQGTRGSTETGIELATWRSLREDKAGSTLFSLRLTEANAADALANDSAATPLLDGANINVVSVVSGYALNCRVAISGREPTLEAFKNATSLKASFTVHRCSEEEARKVVFARSCRNRLVMCVGFEDKNKRHTRALSIKSSADALYALSSVEEQQSRVEMLARTIDEMRARCGKKKKKGDKVTEHVAYSMQMLLAEQDIPRLVLTALQMCRAHLDKSPRNRDLAATCARFLLVITAGNMVVKRLLVAQERLLFDFLGKEVEIEALLIEIYRDNQAALGEPKPRLVEKLFEAGKESVTCLPEILELFSALTLCDGKPMKHNQDLIAAMVFERCDAGGFFPKIRAAPEETGARNFRLHMQDRRRPPDTRPSNAGAAGNFGPSGASSKLGGDRPGTPVTRAERADSNVGQKRGGGGFIQRSNATLRQSMVGRPGLMRQKSTRGPGTLKGRNSRQSSIRGEKHMSGRQASVRNAGGWVDAVSYQHITEHIVISRSPEPEHKLLVYVHHTFRLFADLCGFRNRNARALLLRQPVFSSLCSYETLTGLLQSPTVPSFIRSSVTRLWHALYLDAEPHHPTTMLCTARSRSEFRAMVRLSPRFDEEEIEALVRESSSWTAPSLPQLFADVMKPLNALTGADAEDPAHAHGKNDGKGRAFGTVKTFGSLQVAGAKPAQRVAASRRHGSMQALNNLDDATVRELAMASANERGQAQRGSQARGAPPPPAAAVAAPVPGAKRRRSTMGRFVPGGALAGGGGGASSSQGARGRTEDLTSDHRLELCLRLLRSVECLLRFGVVDAIAAVVPAEEHGRGHSQHAAPAAAAPAEVPPGLRGTLASRPDSPRVSPGLSYGSDSDPENPKVAADRKPPKRGSLRSTRSGSTQGRSSRLGSIIKGGEGVKHRQPPTVQAVLHVVVKVLNMNSTVQQLIETTSKRAIVHNLNRCALRVVTMLFHRQLNSQLNRFQTAFEQRLVEDLRIRSEFVKRTAAARSAFDKKEEARKKAEQRASVGRPSSTLVRVQSRLGNMTMPTGMQRNTLLPGAGSPGAVPDAPIKPSELYDFEAGQLRMTSRRAIDLAAELHRMPIFNDDVDNKMLTNFSVCLLQLQTCPDGDIRREAMRILVQNVVAHDETLSTQLQQIAFISSKRDYTTLCNIQQAARILWRLSTYVLDQEERVRRSAVSKAIEVLDFVTGLARDAYERDADMDGIPKEMAILQGSNILPEIISLVRLPPVRVEEDPEDALLDEDDGVDFVPEEQGQRRKSREHTGRGDDRYCDLREKPPGAAEKVPDAAEGGEAKEALPEDPAAAAAAPVAPGRERGVTLLGGELVRPRHSVIQQRVGGQTPVRKHTHILSPDYNRRTFLEPKPGGAGVRNTLLEIDNSRRASADRATRKASMGTIARTYDNDYLTLMRRCLEFITLYCRAGKAFQEEVLPNARYVQEHLAVAPLENPVAEALRAMFAQNHTILNAVAPKVSETVVKLTCLNGQRLPYLSLLRGMLVATSEDGDRGGEAVSPKIQSAVLQVVIDNQPVLLDHLGEEWQEEMKDFVEKREFLFEQDSILRYHSECIDLLAACSNPQTLSTLHSLLSFQQCAALVIGQFSEEKQLELLVQKHAAVLAQVRAEERLSESESSEYTSSEDDDDEDEDRGRRGSLGEGEDEDAGEEEFDDEDEDDEERVVPRMWFGVDQNKHFLSTIHLKMPWVKLMTKTYLECQTCSHELFGSMITWIWPDAHLRLLRQTVTSTRNGNAAGGDGQRSRSSNRKVTMSSFGVRKTTGGGQGSFFDASESGPPTKSLMEEFADDVGRCLMWRSEAQEASEQEDAWGEAGPAFELSVGSKRGPIPDSWHSGKLVVDYVCDAIVPAVEACYANKFLMRELMRGKLRPMDDRCRKKLASALFDFVQEVGPENMEHAQLSRLHSVLERYLDVESVLTGQLSKQAALAQLQATSRSNRKKALALQPMLRHKEQQSNAVPDSEEATLVGSCWNTFVLSFVELGPQPHEEAVQQIALLMMSEKGAACIPYLVASMRLDIVRAQSEHYGSKTVEIAEATAMGLDPSGPSTETGAFTAKRSTRQIEMALHAFLLMLHYRSNSSLIHIQDHTLPQSDLSCVCVNHALEAWTLHKVILGLMGLPLLETPSISLMALLFSCQATRSAVQNGVINYAAGEEGERFALQLKSLLLRVGEWVKANRELRKKRIIYEKQITHAKAIELRQTMATEQRKKTGVFSSPGARPTNGLFGSRETTRDNGKKTVSNLHVALAVGKFKRKTEQSRASAKVKAKAAADAAASGAPGATGGEGRPGSAGTTNMRASHRAGPGGAGQYAHLGSVHKKARMTGEAHAAAAQSSIKKARLTSEVTVSNPAPPRRTVRSSMTSARPAGSTGAGAGGGMPKGARARGSVIGALASSGRQSSVLAAGVVRRRSSLSPSIRAAQNGPIAMFGEGSNMAIATALSRRGTMSALPGQLTGPAPLPAGSGVGAASSDIRHRIEAAGNASPQTEQLRVARSELDAAEHKNKTEGTIARDSLRFVLMLVSEAPRRVHDWVRTAAYDVTAATDGEPSGLLEHLVQLLQVFTTETSSVDDEDSADCTETLCEILFWLTKGNPRNQIMVVRYGYMDIASTLLRNVTYSLEQVSKMQTSSPYGMPSTLMRIPSSLGRRDSWGSRGSAKLQLPRGGGSAEVDIAAIHADAVGGPNEPAQNSGRRSRRGGSDDGGKRVENRQRMSRLFQLRRKEPRENAAVHNVREPVLRTVLEMLRERDVVGLATIMKDSSALLRQLTHAIKLGLAMARANMHVAAEADVLEESYLALVVLRTLAQVVKLHASRPVQLRLKRQTQAWDFDAFCSQLRSELRSVAKDALELEQHVGSVELAMADGSVTVTLFRRSPLAIALLAKNTWREATLNRLREIPRGVGVSENMKARAFFKKINEIALEALDEAESQYATMAINFLFKALLVATLVLNALVMFGYYRKDAPRGDGAFETTTVLVGEKVDDGDDDDWWSHDRQLEYSFLKVTLATLPRWSRPLLGRKLVLDFGNVTWYVGKVQALLMVLQVMVNGFIDDALEESEALRKQGFMTSTDTNAATQKQGNLSADMSQNSGAIQMARKARLEAVPTDSSFAWYRRLARNKRWFQRRLAMPLFGLSASALGNVYQPIWYSLTLLPYVRADKTISFVTRALRLSSANIARILLFMCVCMFTVSGFVFISFSRVECDSVWQCFLSGITNAILGVAPFVQPDEYTNLGDVPLYPIIASRQLYLWEHWMSAFWVLLNVMAFIFFVLLFQALITGIILNEFTAMYMDQQMLKIDMRECCLVCSLTADRLERAGHDFRYHTRHDHDPLEYVSLAISLREWWQKGTRTFTAHETYALNCLLQGTPAMLPVHTCFALKETALEAGGAAAAAAEGDRDRARTPPNDLDAAVRHALDDDPFGNPSEGGDGDGGGRENRASFDDDNHGGGDPRSDFASQISALMDAVHRLEHNQRAREQPSDFEDGYPREAPHGRDFPARESTRAADPNRLREKFLQRGSTVHAHRGRAGRASMEAHGPGPHSPMHASASIQAFPGREGANSPVDRKLTGPLT